MADHPDASPPPISQADRDRPPGVPRWVKVSAALILLVVAALVISRVAGVEHGPGLHSGSTASPDPTPPAATSPRPTPPAGAGAGHTGPPPGVTHGSQE